MNPNEFVVVYGMWIITAMLFAVLILSGKI